jgi:hypothetical protein
MARSGRVASVSTLPSRTATEGYLTVLVDELAANAERAIEAKLTGRALEVCRAAGYESE